jgi:hypothetical protein
VRVVDEREPKASRYRESDRKQVDVMNDDRRNRSEQFIPAAPDATAKPGHRQQRPTATSAWSRDRNANDLGTRRLGSVRSSTGAPVPCHDARGDTCRLQELDFERDPWIRAEVVVEQHCDGGVPFGACSFAVVEIALVGYHRQPIRIRLAQESVALAA